MLIIFGASAGTTGGDNMGRCWLSPGLGGLSKGQTVRQTDKQADDRRTNRQTDRQMDRTTDRYYHERLGVDGISTHKVYPHNS